MLEQAQIDQYRSFGFLVLESFFSPSLIAKVASDADALSAQQEVIHADNIRCRWQSHLQTGEPILDTVDPVTDLSPAIAKLAKSDSLMELMTELFDEPAFLFKDKLIYKPPGALGHAPHQDYIYWPSFPKSFTTVLVAIDSADEQNGCLSLFRGHHTKGYLSPRDGDFHDLSESLFPASSRVELRLKPGDIAVFGCFLPHGSPPNRSARFRRHLYLSYNAGSDGGDLRQKHYDEFHGWLKRRYAEYGCHQFFYR